MKLSDEEIQWLASCFPSLHYNENALSIEGELDFCAAYDKGSRKLIICSSDENRNRDSFVNDVFDIVICLDTIDRNGWPKVYEVGGKHTRIAEQCNVDVGDLHFNSDDSCCLGKRQTSEGRREKFRVKEFFQVQVIPFLYRLSYTEKRGIDASSNDLWGEYSHGLWGTMEYREEIRTIERNNPSRNDLCPCGSGKKYKNCHLDEVQFERRQIVSGKHPRP